MSAAATPKRCHLVLGKVDAPALRVFADVADDVGQLKGDAELMRVVEGRALPETEDSRRHQSDDAGDTMAIALERSEILVAILVEVHRHAVDDRIEVRVRQIIDSDDFLECERDRMLRRAVEDRPDLATPPRQLDARNSRVGSLVDDIVDFAAERVQRGDCTPARRGQQPEAVGRSSSRFARPLCRSRRPDPSGPNGAAPRTTSPSSRAGSGSDDAETRRRAPRRCA